MSGHHPWPPPTTLWERDCFCACRSCYDGAHCNGAWCLALEPPFTRKLDTGASREALYLTLAEHKT